MRDGSLEFSWCMTGLRTSSPSFIKMKRTAKINPYTHLLKNCPTDVLIWPAWSCFVAFACFRLTSSSLRRRYGRWTTFTRKQRSWEVSRSSKAAWPASPLTPSFSVWRLTTRRWDMEAVQSYAVFTFVWNCTQIRFFRLTGYIYC